MVANSFPTASVIVPNYNHAAYLRQRLESILKQTFQDFELILLDDCSTDDSRAILSEYAGDARVSIHFNETNSGSTFKQWNKGVRLARGQYVWIAESDDYSDEHFLERLAAALESAPEIAFAYCRSWRVCEGEPNTYADVYLEQPDSQRWTKNFVVDGREECRERFVYFNPVPNASAVVFRKAAYEEAGGADENLRLCGDWKLWTAIALLGKIAYLAEPLNYFRSHGASVRNWSKPAGVCARESDEVAAWIAEKLHHPNHWVPLLMSLRVPLAAKREALRRAWETDPHPLRNALGPALRTLRLKFLRHWRQLPSARRDAPQ
jgi:GT2 family glycosyltransferase